MGKTTISTIISLVLTNLKSRVLHLCGDDLHKWERGDDNWKTITHLNPKANNLWQRCRKRPRLEPSKLSTDRHDFSDRFTTTIYRSGAAREHRPVAWYLPMDSMENPTGHRRGWWGKHSNSGTSDRGCDATMTSQLPTAIFSTA